MLESLKIYNGSYTPDFDPYCNIYTVNVEEDVTFLDLEYKVSKGEVAIINNSDFVSGENIVTIEINDEGKINDYYLYVYQEKSIASSQFDNDYFSLDVASDVKTPLYIAPLIACICFLLILILFKKLFLRKR